MEFHVVSKFDSRVHATFTLDKSTQPQPTHVAPDCVRVQPVVLSLTSNNLSYAAFGDLLHWWDTYPVPRAAPEEFNDDSRWGVVPAWGFGIIIESTISQLPPGTLLFGFWPMATALVDLNLQASDPEGHWREVSDHRANVMPLYNLYQQKESYKLPASKEPVEFVEQKLVKMAWMSVFGAVWQTGFLLNRYTFTSDPNVHPAISPLGNQIPWTNDDADLSEAVLITTGASSKTARGFAWQIFSKRKQGSGPLAFLQVTSDPQAIGDVASQFTNLPGGTFSYSQLEKLIAEAGHFRPRKLVIVDFGARDNAVRKLIGLLNEQLELKDAQLVIVHVGSEQKIYSAEEARESEDDLERFGKIPCNTADILDSVIELVGRKSYDRDIQLNRDEWSNNMERNIPDLRLVWGHGISGKWGMHSGWDRLTAGSVAPHECLVYRLW